MRPATHRANAQRWARQLLLYRYSVLLAQLKSAFPVTSEQEEALNRTILNMTWIDSAFNSDP